MEYDDVTAAAWELSEYDYDGNVTAPWEDEYDNNIALFHTVLLVLRSLATAVGLLTNTLLLVLLATSPRQRTVSNMFLLQRAVAEMINLLSTVFITVFEFSNLKFNLVICTALNVVMHVGTVANLMFFMLFTMDSYLASRPQHHTLPSRCKVMQLTSAATWLLAAAVGVTAYFSADLLDYGEPFCLLGPLHQHFDVPQLLINVFINLVVPLVVVWVFVSVALPPRPAVPKEEEGHEGPNRRLLLGLASTFTVPNGVYWVIMILNYILPMSSVFIIFYSLPFVEKAINPILVVCLSEGLRQKMVGWLPARRSASLPLQDL